MNHPTFQTHGIVTVDKALQVPKNAITNHIDEFCNDYLAANTREQPTEKDKILQDKNSGGD